MNALAGTGRLVRLALRRDRFILPIWILIIAITPMSLVSTVAEVYPTAAERTAYVEVTNSNPAMLANYGRIYDTTLAAVSAQRSGTMPLVIAVIALLMVIRHTRTDEEAGRRELLGSTVVGRQAPLAAALIATCGACAVLGLLVMGGLLAKDLPLAGSFALAAGYVGSGVCFAAAGALAAQLTEGAGGARGIAISVLGIAYFLRAVGEAGQADGGGPGIAWLSPLFWPHAVRAYADEVWWVLVPFAVWAVVFAVLAAVLNARRDFGAGLLPARRGHAQAPAWLRGPLGLAWRLHRLLFGGWTVWFVIFAVFMGGTAESVGELYSSSSDIASVVAAYGGGGAIVDQFLRMMFLVLAMVTSAYGVQAALRMRREETNSRVEPLLATSVSRWRWAASHLAFALLGPAVGLVLAGLVGGAVYGSAIGETGLQAARVAGAALAMVPAVWVVTAIAVALFGIAPRSTVLSWVPVAGVLLLGIVGPLVDLPAWMLDVSPFAHVPNLPGGELTLAPLVWMTAIAAALIAAGAVGFRRRDVPVG